ncbi:GDP-mannose 4,6-dehydratase [Calothrix sp. NIES-4071]|nr:GDP-mannose 4,6-dehydratase [Calothrix sp. NIES-4071]BAZ63253.1 GDP-mannose 4,6-dehydratase [Calothrix sp. NIES-4105]
MLQHFSFSSFVLTSKDTYSVQKFLKIAFGYVNVNWNTYIEFNARCQQLIEVYLLIGGVTEVK